MNVHIRDLQGRHGTAGTGHIYQSRYKNYPIRTERQFFNVCRYVEANARNAGLVQRAEHWPWSSLVLRGPAEGIDLLSMWPLKRPSDWLDLVNRPSALHPVAARKRARKIDAPIAGAFLPDPRLSG